MNMGEKMQVIQIEIYLRKHNDIMMDDIETILSETANIPNDIQVRRFDTQIKYFGLLDNMNEPVEAGMLQKALKEIKTVYYGEVLSCDAWVWDMDVDRPDHRLSA